LHENPGGCSGHAAWGEKLLPYNRQQVLLDSKLWTKAMPEPVDTGRQDNPTNVAGNQTSDSKQHGAPLTRPEGVPDIEENSVGSSSRHSIQQL